MSKKGKHKKRGKIKKDFKTQIIKTTDNLEQKVSTIKIAKEKLVNKGWEVKKNFVARLTVAQEFLRNMMIKERLNSFYQKTKVTLKKWNNIFCTGMVCETNLKRDIGIVSVAILVAVVFLVMGQYTSRIKEVVEERGEMLVVDESLVAEFEENSIDNIRSIQDNIQTQGWKEFSSDWYGFKIKYPEDWGVPTISTYKKDALAEYRISFLSKLPEEKNILGFEVSVYNINKIKELSSTSEFPKVKNLELKNSGSCNSLEGHVLETGDYPAEEIYISPLDDCYFPVLFFSVTKGQYLYNIAPIVREIQTDNDLMVEVSDNLPEFFAAISQFENIDIVRPKPRAVQPRITAPKPASHKVVGGRLVCEKDKDKPGKSDKGKGKHLDMECCLDPDEYPNPHCYYDPAKYGKYLK
ncbi:MAG: hypothetical protein WAV16_02665 [Candidatus Moraniibacteriota bacterium]